MTMAAMTRVLRVPIALADAGQRIAARSASRSTRYRCPGCLEPVSPRLGDQRQAHFAHHPSSAGHGETERHRLAKHQIALLLEPLVRRGKARLPIGEPCRGCARELHRRLPTFERIAIEWAAGSDRRVDVALLNASDELVFAVEVFVTHRTEHARAAPAGVPWVEVAVEVGADPATWPIVAAGKRLLCVDCDAIRKLRTKFAAEDRARQLAANSDVRPLAKPTVSRTLSSGRPRALGYRVGAIECPSCRKKVPFLGWDDEIPPDPRPSTVRRLRWRFPETPVGATDYSTTERAAIVRGGWANWCPACGELLGTAPRPL